MSRVSVAPLADARKCPFQPRLERQFLRTTGRMADRGCAGALNSRDYGRQSHPKRTVWTSGCRQCNVFACRMHSSARTHSETQARRRRLAAAFYGRSMIYEEQAERRLALAAEALAAAQQQVNAIKCRMETTWIAEPTERARVRSELYDAEVAADTARRAWWVAREDLSRIQDSLRQCATPVQGPAEPKVYESEQRAMQRGTAPQGPAGYRDLSEVARLKTRRWL